MACSKLGATKDAPGIMEFSSDLSESTSKYRNFVFTFNNYPDTTLVDNLACRYIVYGREVSKSGTPHLQGFIIFTSQKMLRTVIKLMPGCHVEVAKTVQPAITYCKKDAAFTERGIPPVSKASQGLNECARWKRIREASEEGRNEDIPEVIRFKNPRLIQYHRNNYLNKRKLADTDTEHLWYYGQTGSGKSRKARTDWPDAFLKTCNKWWDGYEDEETVIIEDFDISHAVLAHHCKIWADRYPFPAEVKGGMRKIRPKRIIITSNYHPEEIWPMDKNSLEPIERRFNITQFSTFFNKQPEDVVNAKK